MKTRDIIRQGMQNLLRHRGRTMLTVLGVIVGCCSVVIMISIGIGLRLSTEATLAQMGDLTRITVERVDSQEAVKLDANAVQKLASLEHVSAVIPKITSYEPVKVYAGTGGRYLLENVTILGEDIAKARIEGYELAEGDWDSLKKGDILVGQYLAYAFRDTKRPSGYDTIERYNYYDWETDSFSDDIPDPYVNPMEESLTLVLGEDADGTDSKKVSAELHVGGVMKQDWNRGYETSEGIMIDLSTWQELLKEYKKQTTGKTASDPTYDTIIVKVDDISRVESVETEIRKLGLRTYSMESIRKPMEQEAAQKQMLLGGVGAVSLFVAALGIANTMIMAISERIREIGVMKALGCFLRDVRRMFLLEAGCIGFIGGVIGIALSFLISWIMNHAGNHALFGSTMDYYQEATAAMDMSVIPWWLAIFAVLFSIMIGVCAGLYPAEKAVRIPALEAIKHE